MYDLVNVLPFHNFFAGGTLVANCDANYGLLPRDVEITRNLTDVKRLYGFPKKFRAAYAKNSNDRVFQVAKLLHDADMCKGVTLSLQSTDSHTLEVIQRKNIPMDDFEQRIQQYHAAGIGTYTELILGLPGETYDSFANGIDRILRAGQHHGLHIYLCLALPDSELSDPAYMQEHGIRTVRGPLLQQHATPDDGPVEMADVVIATKTMPIQDWLKAFMFAWTVQTFHCFGLTTEAAKAAVNEYGMSYREFYESLHREMMCTLVRDRHLVTLIALEYEATVNQVAKGCGGGSWGRVAPEFGNIVWTTEEASFLTLACRDAGTYFNLREWLDNWLLPMVSARGEKVHWTPVHDALCLDQRRLSHPSQFPFNGDKERWAREVVWFGRKAEKHARKI